MSDHLSPHRARRRAALRRAPHRPPTDADVATMLERLGFDSLDALMDAAVPGGDPRGRRRSTCPTPLSEEAAGRELRAHRRTPTARARR